MKTLYVLALCTLYSSLLISMEKHALTPAALLSSDFEEPKRERVQIISIREDRPREVKKSVASVADHVLSALKEGANPNIVITNEGDSEPSTRLAVRVGSIGALEALASYGARLHQDLLSELADYNEAKENDKAIIWFLASHGLSFSDQSLEEAAEHGWIDDPKTFRFQLYGLLGRDALLYSIIRGTTESALNLVSTWKSAQKRNQLTPERIQSLNKAVMLAAAQGNEKVLDRIIELFNAEIEPRSYQQALILASFSGKLKSIELIYQVASRENGWKEAIEEALLQAAVQRHLAVVKLILDISHSLSAFDFIPVLTRLSFFINTQDIDENTREKYREIETVIREASEKRIKQALSLQLPEGVISQPYQTFFPEIGNK